jgi:hypothetical protein
MRYALVKIRRQRLPPRYTDKFAQGKKSLPRVQDERRLFSFTRVQTARQFIGCAKVLGLAFKRFRIF